MKINEFWLIASWQQQFVGGGKSAASQYLPMEIHVDENVGIIFVKSRESSKIIMYVRTCAIV